MAKYREKNPEQVRTASREWYARNIESQRDRVRNNRQPIREFLQTVKDSSGCMRCGIRGGNLHFHHVGERRFFLGNARIFKPIEEIIRELAKCIVLCISCHRKVHAGTPFIERPVEGNTAL